MDLKNQSNLDFQELGGHEIENSIQGWQISLRENFLVD